MCRAMKPKQHALQGMLSCGGVQTQALVLQPGVTDQDSYRPRQLCPPVEESECPPAVPSDFPNTRASQAQLELLYDDLNALSRTQRLQSTAIVLESKRMRDHLIDLHLVALQIGQSAVETMRLCK